MSSNCTASQARLKTIDFDGIHVALAEASAVLAILESEIKAILSDMLSRWHDAV
jgi:hypothetical protein